MRCDQEQLILQNVDILSESYFSPDIRARESQMKEITMCLLPITEASKPMNCWLHSKSGVGKTATACCILHKLNKEAGVRGLYLNCWENPTFFSVLEHIAMELRMLGAEKLSTSFKLTRLKRHLSNDRLIIVLDEIDQPPPEGKKRDSIQPFRASGGWPGMRLQLPIRLLRPGGESEVQA